MEGSDHQRQNWDAKEAQIDYSASNLGASMLDRSNVVDSMSHVSAKSLSSSSISEVNSMHEPFGKRAPELQSKQSDASNSLDQYKTDNLLDGASDQIKQDTMMTKSSTNQKRNDGIEAGKVESEADVAQISFKSKTKLSETQAQEQQKEDNEREYEFSNNVEGQKNNINNNDLESAHTNMDIQHLSDKNDLSSVMDHNSQNSSEDGSDDQKHQTDQQQTQDSDLSPSHSTVSTKTNNDNDDNNKDHDLMNNSALGRNRRVRQKNRYFADFHCMQLVKGCRSKDDYDAYSPSTSATRSSNRRSTTDSSRGLHTNNNLKDNNNIEQAKDPTELFTIKHCRKCSERTPHDEGNGCQACLYKKIVSSSKRQKTMSSRSRASTRQQQQQLQQQQQQQKEEQQLQNPVVTIKREPITGQKTDSLKRKWMVKHGLDDNVISICREIDSSNQDNIEQRGTNDEPKRKVIIKTNDDHVVNDKMIDNCDTKNASDSLSGPMNKSGNNSSDAKDNSSNNIDNVDNQNQLILTKPDTWTPDQVAQYVSSKGFVNESDLFRQEAVDGISLLMMKRTDFTHGLKMKLGPALKLYEQVCRLRRDYERETATAS